MRNNHIMHGIIAGTLSAMTSIIFSYAYQYLLICDFSDILNIGSIFGSTMIGTMLISSCYFILDKTKKNKNIGILNMSLTLLSVFSILWPLMISIPLEIDSPELFPGLVIPMHLFPILYYISITPFFRKNNMNLK